MILSNEIPAAFVFAICCVSFYFQNVIGPQAQAKLGTLLISMKQKSPEVDIPEGVFYDEIDGYNLKVQRKDRKTGMLYDVIIYDFSNNFDNARIIVADSGRLEIKGYTTNGKDENNKRAHDFK